MFKRLENLIIYNKYAHELVIDLLYPAVLGSVMYERISNLNYNVYENILFILLVTIYVADFFYIKKDDIKKTYNIINALFDFIFIMLIALANNEIRTMVNVTSNEKESILLFCALLFLNKVVGVASEYFRVDGNVIDQEIFAGLVITYFNSLVLACWLIDIGFDEYCLNLLIITIMTFDIFYTFTRRYKGATKISEKISNILSRLHNSSNS